MQKIKLSIKKIAVNQIQPVPAEPVEGEVTSGGMGSTNVCCV
jgi:hypothetical protein